MQTGSGYIHWGTGETSLRMETLVEAPGEETIRMVYTGTAKVDRTAGTFTLHVGTQGFEQRGE